MKGVSTLQDDPFPQRRSATNVVCSPDRLSVWKAAATLAGCCAIEFHRFTRAPAW